MRGSEKSLEVRLEKLIRYDSQVFFIKKESEKQIKTIRFCFSNFFCRKFFKFLFFVPETNFKKFNITGVS